MANFTNTKINQTYQRVVQVDGAVLQDGLGNTLSGSMSDLTVNGTLSITGHSNVSESLSRLDNFSSSLNDTFATDAELSSVSSSLASETAQLLDFSASLNNDFATDAELEAVSSSLALETAQLLDFSSSLNNDFATDAELTTAVSALNAATGSYALKTSISGSFNTVSSSLALRLADQENFSSSLDATFATDTEVSTAVSGLNAATGSYAIKTQISGSFNELSSSFATRFDNFDVSALNAATGSYAIKSQITGSFNELSSSFATRFDNSDVSALNAATSSYALITQISGSSDILSASLATRVDSLAASTSSYALVNQENTFELNQNIAGTLFASASKLGSHHWGGQVFASKAQFNDFVLEQNRESSDGTDFLFIKSRGIPGSETHALAGDEVFNLKAYAYKSGSSSQGSSIMFSDYEFVAGISTDVKEIRPQSASGDIKFTVRDIDRSLNVITIDCKGNLSSSNDISASTYYGDGSQLNNLPNTSGQLPPSNNYLVPAFINGTPGGSTSLTASAGIYKCMYSGANGTHTVELPDATSVENTYRTIRFISDNSVTANDIVQLSGSLGQTIDGSATYDMDRNYEGIMIWSDGSNWFRIQSKA